MQLFTLLAKTGAILLLSFFLLSNLAGCGGTGGVHILISVVELGLNIDRKTSGTNASFYSNSKEIAINKASKAKSLLVEGSQDNIKSALHLIRQAGSIATKQSIELYANKVTGSDSRKNTFRWMYTTHLEILSQAQNKAIISIKDSTSESFIVSQRCQYSTVAKTLLKMTARITVERGKLQELISEQQTILDNLRSTENSMMKALSKGYGDAAKVHRSNIRRLQEELIEVNIRLASNYPEYTELTNPQPLPLKEVQDLLNTDEALLAIIVDKKQTYLWGVRKKKAEWWILPVEKKQIDEIVKTLRLAMNPSVVTDQSDLPDFPVDVAQKLYSEIVAQAAPMLKGAKRVFVVADGTLQSIPFGVMVNGGRQQDSYRDTNWLTKEYAFAYLPSISSLKELRMANGNNIAQNSFIGFSTPNPIHGSGDGQVGVVAVFDKREIGPAYINGIRQLTSPPGSADDLKNLAMTFGTSSQSVYQQYNVAEENWTYMDLSNFNVIAFATHGLLTAEEIIQLKLNADWVMLFVFDNDSPGFIPDTKNIFCLTKAFFYAGAKTLLVSSWAVESNSAEKITTSMFKILLQNPHIGKAEALRQVRLQLLNDQQHPYLSHPALWAPFTVVGKVERIPQQ